jgi:hypothetical protein
MASNRVSFGIEAEKSPSIRLGKSPVCRFVGHSEPANFCGTVQPTFRVQLSQGSDARAIRLAICLISSIRSCSQMGHSSMRTKMDGVFFL